MDGNRKNLIFTLFQRLASDPAHDQHSKYLTQLIDNKRDYAEAIGVDFKYITATDLSYVELNHLKFQLLEEYTDQYDKVMYVDMDVVFNTDENVFDNHDGFCLHAKDYRNGLKGKLEPDMNKRSWWYKHFLADALCMHDLTTHDGLIPNTGIMITDRPLGFTEALPKLEQKVDEVNAEEMWPIEFDYNNEALFAYYSQTNGIEWNLMDDDWNHIHRKNQPFDPNKKIYHFISKEFEHGFEPTT